MAPKWSPAIKLEWLEAHEAGESQGDIAKRYGASKYTVCTAIGRLQSGESVDYKSREAARPGDMARVCAEVFGRLHTCRVLGIRPCEVRDIARASDETALIRLHLLARCVLLDVTIDDLRGALVDARAISRARIGDLAMSERVA